MVGGGGLDGEKRTRGVWGLSGGQILDHREGGPGRSAVADDCISADDGNWNNLHDDDDDVSCVL